MTADTFSCEVFAPLNTKTDNNSDTLQLTGVASTTSKDSNGETISREVIDSLAEQAVGLNVFIDHDHRFDKAVGTITDAKVQNDQLVITADILPEHASAIKGKLDFGMNFGFSIAGMPVFDKRERGLITDYNLKEISITSLPANWDTYGTIQVKSIVKSTSFAGAVDYVLNQKNSDNMAEEPNNVNNSNETSNEENKALTVDDVIGLINDAFAEKEKAIVEAVKDEMKTNIESIVDAKLSENKPEEKEEDDGAVENEKADCVEDEKSETEEEVEKEKQEEEELNTKSIDAIVDKITANLREEFEAPASKFQQFQSSMNKKSISTFLDSDERDRYGRNKKYL